MRLRKAYIICVTATIWCGSAGRAWGAPSGNIAGHWAGAIQVPGTELKIDIDFRQGASGWEGDISIPAQGAKDLVLAKINVDGAAVGFELPGVPGSPTFSGKLADDGKSISGDFTQGGQTFPFNLTTSLGGAVKAKDALAGFDEWVEQALSDWKVPGLALGIVVDGEVVLAKGYGKRIVEKDLPVTSKTLFAIGSSTKAFTAFALGTQVDEGKLEWDKPVINYLPAFRLHDDHATTHITPRDLVTHRSGLPRHDLAWYNNTTITRAEMVSRLPYYLPNEDLRGKFQYNNMMFLAAGYLVGELDHKSWEDSIRARILGPLEMNATNFSVNDSQKSADFALPYEYKDEKVIPMKFRNIDNVGPAGSINSNIEDMTHWLAVQLGKGAYKGKKLINEATLTDMHISHMAMATPPDPEAPDVAPPSYGMGWFIQPYRGHYYVHHGGAIDGFITLVSFFPNDGIGIVAFVNLNGNRLPIYVTRHAADRLLGLEPRDWSGRALAKWKAGEETGKEAEKKKDMFRHPDTKPSHALADYAAEYRDPGYGIAKVEVKGEQLVLTYNEIVTPLEHWHYDVFNGLENPEDHTFENLRIQFLTNLKGDVDRLAIPLEPSVREIVFERLPDAKMSDPAYLQRFTGDYELATQVVKVGVQGNRLTLAVPGQPQYELIPDRNDEFNLKGLNGYSVRFSADKEGSITAFFNQPEGVYELKRQKN